MSEPSRLVVCPNPAVYAYHSNEALHGTQIERDLIWNIALLEFVVITPMCFLRCAREGIYFVRRVFDTRIWSTQEERLGIFKHLRSDIMGQIMSFDVFNFVHATYFDAAASLMALKGASEVDWTGTELPNPFLLYRFNTGKVLPAPVDPGGRLAHWCS